MATAKTMPLKANVELLLCVHGRGKLGGEEDGGKSSENSCGIFVTNVCAFPLLAAIKLTQQSLAVQQWPLPSLGLKLLRNKDIVSPITLDNNSEIPFDIFGDYFI